MKFLNSEVDINTGVATFVFIYSAAIIATIIYFL